VSCTDLTCDFTDTSTDSQGSVVGWSWDLGDGNTSAVQHPTHTYAAAGTYTVTLTATDDVGASDTASRSVTVPSANQAPTASFTSSCTDLTCDFTDTSTDGDGTVTVWSWDFGDGNTSTEQHPTHTYAAAGTYTVTLTATDDDGDSDTVTGSVSATEPNDAPVASFTSSCTDLACDFTDTSTDGDGTITAWSWDFGDGWSTNGANPSHTYFEPGTYTVTLTVWDDDGASSTVSQAVTVGEAPAASFTSSCTDLTCDLTDTSTDGDGTVTAWSWDFGDGNTSAVQHPTHTYAAAGTYTVTLTATDNDGNADTASSTVTVSAPPVVITLAVTGYKVRGRQKADLVWSGASSASMDVYRDGALIFTTPNDGFQTDAIDNRGQGVYNYQVCEAGTTSCSEVVTVTF
jgi:PKD repeat protein